MKNRVLPEEISDDPFSIELKPKVKKVIEKQESKTDQEERLKRLELEEIDRFNQWQSEMWIRMMKNQKKRTQENLPDYYKKFDDAKQKHLQNYWINLNAIVQGIQ